MVDNFGIPAIQKYLTFQSTEHFSIFLNSMTIRILKNKLIIYFNLIINNPAYQLKNVILVYYKHVI